MWALSTVRSTTGVLESAPAIARGSVVEAPTVFWEDIETGREYWGSEETADRDEMVDFATRYDPWPMHLSDAGGQATPYGGLIASGGYTIGLWYRSGHAIWNQPGALWAFEGGFDWHVRFLRPLRPGARVQLRIVTTEKRLSSTPGRGIAHSESHLVGADGEPVLSLDLASMLAKRPV
jgi:acyl dehydratase